MTIVAEHASVIWTFISSSPITTNLISAMIGGIITKWFDWFRRRPIIYSPTECSVGIGGPKLLFRVKSVPLGSRIKLTYRVSKTRTEIFESGVLSTVVGDHHFQYFSINRAMLCRALSVDGDMKLEDIMNRVKHISVHTPTGLRRVNKLRDEETDKNATVI